jgi:hypothetical protein
MNVASRGGDIPECHTASRPHRQLMLAAGNGLISVVRVRSQPLRYVLLAAGSFALAMAGTVTGTICEEQAAIAQICRHQRRRVPCERGAG